jgi:2-(3-amino-3-carboxypropyl)histidine synthase
VLPSNYNYEIHKTVLKINQACKGPIYKVSLQFPEGLLMHAGLIADLVQTFCSTDDCKVECLILGDVTYGACCIDDLASQKLGCDFIVHYGHSCLVPIPNMVISNVLYVFVEIGIDIRHLLETVAFNVK